jgi:hypothetical protein
MAFYFLTEFFRYFFRVLHEASSFVVKISAQLSITPCIVKYSIENRRQKNQNLLLSHTVDTTTKRRTRELKEILLDHAVYNVYPKSFLYPMK